ncbi:MAG: hypothetical protein Q8L13_11740 [Bradyrhizobium sp.]|uniref:hypothetical protein n=1 Tax=Bradyrhizobium sp. TaxID=376 RepID=UPI00272F135F|nr:hypothetical protein [Bradyrhizobium sp.]MDP1866997.1 hypothetical protein [Bradyrhizobium sp.]
MPADLAGALLAIKQKFEAEWVVGSEPRTRITEVNKDPPAPWPPRDADNKLENYVLIAPVAVDGLHLAFGKPGNQTYLDPGLIHIHVFVPVGEGTEDANALAVAAGNIFRARKFYDDVTPGCYVRTWTPRVDGGGPGDDDGAWYRVSATIPFHYYHRG